MAEKNREAFLALVAPIGIDMNQVSSVLVDKIKQIDYTPNVIKFTDYLKEFQLVEDHYPNEVDRYKAYIAAGDDFCAGAERGDALALLGVLHLLREGQESRNLSINSRRVNIFRQIKRIEEYSTLERIYGRNIIFVGCYASRENRINYLVDRMKVTDRVSSEVKLQSLALEIMATDEDESDKSYGQKIIDCYPKSDFILDCTSLRTLEESCDRLIKIYFGHPFVSPEVDEHASYIANAAAYRSLDLSRQVGAAIFGDNGEIISIGCNEVPAAGGGTYWCNHDDDARDFVLGYDSNQRVREDMARDAIAKLKAKGWLSEERSSLKLSELVNEVFLKGEDPGSDGPWRQSMLSDIIEYGRMVHAEMNALTDAARFRRSTQGATLYCTTMPCHMCTKLIISAGIKRVVYVQPYVKSLVSELFKDSVVFDGTDSDSRVNFCTLKGVTPAGFKRAFAKTDKRKTEDGTAKRWDRLNASATFLTTVPYYKEIEISALNEMMEIPKIREIVGHIFS